MQLIREPYIFTEVDRIRIEALGYVIEGIPIGESLETFLPKHLPNFNLLALLEVVEQYFTPTTQLPISRRLSYRNTSQTFRISFQNSTTVLNDIVAFDRVFYRQQEHILVDHVYCLVPSAYQGTGLIKPVFQASLKEYVNIGVKKICVHASLDGGGYVWARHGFVAIDPNEVKVILEKARKTLTIRDMVLIERIFSKYYQDHPNGTDFPMILWSALPGMKEVLRGASWRGELDLQNLEQFSNFRNYVFRS